ncbi:hypothetical protein N9933_03705, partial [bacterium]|nr:hypothetical protein [bacterium]
MTKKQFDHYLKGGIFIGRYQPKNEHTLIGSNPSAIGVTITYYQNRLISPIQEDRQDRGQFRFNSPDIDGWFPEQD